MTLFNYMREVSDIAKEIDVVLLDKMVERLVKLKSDGGRLFIVGVGGSAANASHAVNDFRKVCGIEAHAPTDNVAELTARTNDEGWVNTFINWMLVSKPTSKDVLLVLSVGGGRYDASPNILEIVEQANLMHMEVLGIVGPEGGYTAQHGDLVLKVPCATSRYITQRGGGTPATPQEPCYVTALTESFQSVVLHALAFDQRLRGL